MRWGIGLAALAVVLALAVPGSAGAFEPLAGYGSFGSGAGELQSEVGDVVVDADGVVYVADYLNDRVDVFATDGTFLRAFGEDVDPGGGDICTDVCQAGTASDISGAMNRPQGLAFGPEGDLFVGDTLNRRVDVYSPEDDFLFAFGREVNAGFGAEGLCTTECREGASDGSSGALADPAGLAFGADGRLYVADYDLNRIAVFTAEGQFVMAFGKAVGGGTSAEVCASVCQEGEAGSGPGEMHNPRDVAAGPAGLLAVADKENNRVDVFTDEGAFVRSFGEVSVPESIEVDAAGTIFVGEWANRRVSEFELDGGFLRTFGEGVEDGAAAFQVCTSDCLAGTGGPGLAAVDGPSGIAFDCRGSVYVAESEFELARVVRFGEPATPLPPCPEEEGPRRLSSTIRSGPPPPSSGFARALRFAGSRRNLRNGTAVLFVRVRKPGRLILHGRGMRRLVRVARRAGQRVRLPVKPKVRLMHFLRRHRKAAIRVKVTLRPADGGPQASIEKRVVLKRRHHHRH